MRRRRWFWTAVGILLVVGPWVVSAGDSLVFRYGLDLSEGPVTRAFSEVAVDV